MTDIPATHQPLTTIAGQLDPPIEAQRLMEYARPARRANNGFPDPVKTLGRFTFYDRVEVQEWWTYFSRATARMHNGGPVR